MPMRTVAAGIAVGLLVLAGCGDSGESGDGPKADLTVGWLVSEGHPSCVYDANASSVECRLVIEGTSPGPAKVTVTVAAYADENTSREVGAASRSVTVEGKVDEPVVVTIPVKRPPHVDEDGETACRFIVDF